MWVKWPWEDGWDAAELFVSYHIGYIIKVIPVHNYWYSGLISVTIILTPHVRMKRLPEFICIITNIKIVVHVFIIMSISQFVLLQEMAICFLFQTLNVNLFSNAKGIMLP